MYSFPVKNLLSTRLCTPFRLLLSPFSTETDKSKEPQVLNNVLDELREPEISEEEILRKRFKSRLPERIYRKYLAKETLDLENKYDLADYRLRKHYATFGESSKLNPGICWPSKEQLQEIIHYDNMFELSLEKRIKNVEEKRLEEERAKQEYESEVNKNMANLDKWMKEFNEKAEKKEAKHRELKAAREKLVEEVSEYLGYDIDPKDPRFKEAVEQRDKEKKKALKAKKQQESYEKMLEKLRNIAQNK